MDFGELRRERAAVADLARLHPASLLWFRVPERPWFRLHAMEKVKDDELRHLSSTATCLDSLRSDVRAFPDVRATVYDLIASFAGESLEAPPERWQSEDAAFVYCRVRTLPLILKHAPQSVIDEHHDAIVEHMEYVWGRVRLDGDWQGVSEAPQEERPGADGSQPNSELDEEAPGYPPHAFHTYWAIRCLDEANARGINFADEILMKRRIAELWTERTLAVQTSLIATESDQADANQLAWALATQFLRPVDIQTSESQRLDLYRGGLEAFFSQQLPSGGWALYRPLFHYPRAGNAYCYTFETLTELLRPALRRDRGRAFRSLLKPYVKNLLEAWGYAKGTAIGLENNLLGWSSGHHPFRRSAEAWATAAVYSFLQCLRRLLGVWSGDAAAAALGVRRPQWPTPSEARHVLTERGLTWSGSSGWTAGARLAALFLHPLEFQREEETEEDPDLPLIGEHQARAAILFGPPGTSKTTLAEAVAGVLGWRFVEVHASDFLTAGMDAVSARADEIFSYLMELDHCVVLFDEIDELLRERENANDPFGRFLTTSMLPKVAKLWEQRRLVYFLATNDVANADRAFRRAQRFDWSIFAAPPGYLPKIQLLKKESGLDHIPGLEWTEVQHALSGSLQASSLGVFALLRYDQVRELAEKMAARAGGDSVNASAVREALGEMGEEMKQELRNGDPYDAFRHAQALERRDSRLLQLALADPVPVGLPDGLEVHEGLVGEKGYLRITNEAIALQPVADGRGPLAFQASEVTMVDTGLLEFKPVHQDETPT